MIAQNQGALIHVRLYGRKNEKASCLIKLDIKKAYDTIECELLEEMLVGLKFPWKFIDLVMVCVRSPKFTLMIIGSTHGYLDLREV